MRLTYKYHLFPTKSQQVALQGTLDAARWVYNQTLEHRRDAWEERQETTSLYDTNKFLVPWKTEHPWLAKQAYAQTLQNAQVRVDLAFQAFFRRVKRGEKPGYPRFKGKFGYDSFTFPQVGFKLLDTGYLRLSKIGAVRVKLHRPIIGDVKTLTIRRDRLGTWYACFSCVVEKTPLPPSSDVVGIDLGLKHLATLSDGEHIPNPRFLKKDTKALVKANRRLSSCAMTSPDRGRRRRVLQHIYRRISNRRRDFAHKLSRKLVDRYQVIAFEDLAIQDMQRDNFRSINKSINDAAWNQLVEYTTYKAEKAGRLCVRVDPRNTTQMCSGCGELVPKELSDRVHSCPHCQLTLDRDHNAALNILALGLQCLGISPRSPQL